MTAEQLIAIIAGSVIIPVGVFLIIREARRPYPDPDSYLDDALREVSRERPTLPDALWEAATDDSLPPGVVAFKDRRGRRWRYPLDEFGDR